MLRCSDSGTIGFITHDKTRTATCGNDSKNQWWMKTIAMNNGPPHHLDFEASPRKNEYMIHTHTLDSTTQAMYYRENTDNNYYYVYHVKTAGADLSKKGIDISGTDNGARNYEQTQLAHHDNNSVGFINKNMDNNNSYISNFFNDNSFDNDYDDYNNIFHD
ncbi:Oidioi.mRNA.OKI2018_I69.chr2.g5348.t1.cds [Oikopleura dioica]|uniref:Oidioi.mRNA.OKI2018_I69.chr2.g5348.t1.cds n=1 Tax=Oikopleura dioica TaxID=34765 RepID=A0ABN7T3F2_OIKDI|nr:Oidioi.mRNA.OKI2018_I69.chr2.g5348.t1.cds [Oikopleura dioica]